MLREILITLYLNIVKVVFNIFNLFKMKKKLVFVISFGDNSKFIYEEIQNRNPNHPIIILYKGDANRYFKDYSRVKSVKLDSINPVKILIAFYHLATTNKIIIDNYFGFLAGMQFKDSVECIQIWHASGAIKKFGFEDKSVQERSSKAKERFKKVYSNFHKVVVGSEEMANIFKRSFHLSDGQILRTGIPRTDIFFDKNYQNDIIQSFLRDNPKLKNKKKLLYAPTYRENELSNFKLKLDIELLHEQLGEDFVILIRLHPAVKNDINFDSFYNDFIFDYSSSNYEINDLLILADLLITDYSSLPYEYSLLQRPMIFFAYDLEDYREKRGLVDNYANSLPGPLAFTTLEVIEAIQNINSYNNDLGAFADKWNEYSWGKSSSNIASYIIDGEVVTDRQLLPKG